MKASEKIKNARKSKGLTQKDLANKVGAAQATINKIESDDPENSIKNPSFELAIKIASVLETDVFDLFGDESLKDLYSKVAGTEIIHLKELVFKSMNEFRFNREHFKMEELIDRYGNDNWVEKGAGELMNYHAMIREFDWGLMETLINMGFCTREEFRSYNIKAYSRADSSRSEAELYAEIREDIKNSAKEKGLEYP